MYCSQYLPALLNFLLLRCWKSLPSGNIGQISDCPYPVCALEFHIKPKFHILLHRKCTDRHAEGRCLLCRVHTGYNNSGKLVSRKLRMERAYRDDPEHGTQSDDRISL